MTVTDAKSWSRNPYAPERLASDAENRHSNAIEAVLELAPSYREAPFTN